MDVPAFLTKTRDLRLRHEEYASLVDDYYSNVTHYYRHGWGDCFHHAPLLDGESLESAIVAQHEMLIREAGIGAGMRVLDVGCGIGGPARSIARRSGAHVRGLNIVPMQLALARKLTEREGLASQVDFVLGDGMRMPFAPDQFDVVYLTESGCHMPDKGAFYREVTRVLKPGGVFIGWDWMQKRPASTQEVERYVQPICEYFAVPNLTLLTELGGLLEQAGLVVRAVEDLGERGSPTRKWWTPLEKQVSSVITKLVTSVQPVLRMMRQSGEALVLAGKAGLFTPLAFWNATKPVQ